MTTDLDCTVSGRGLRSYLPHILASVAVSLIFLGWVLSAGKAHRQAVQDAARSVVAQKAAKSVAFYGNGQLKVLAFYAQPAEARSGSRALVCYGVSNAAAVTIEPSLGDTWPSTGRCLEAAPTKDTEYRLVARDSAGHEQIQTAVLRVQH